MYSVIVGEETRRTDLARAQAVTMAKDLSRTTWRPVRVVSDGLWERLTFRRGDLLESASITPDRRDTSSI